MTRSMMMPHSSGAPAWMRALGRTGREIRERRKREDPPTFSQAALARRLAEELGQSTTASRPGTQTVQHLEDGRNCLVNRLEAWMRALQCSLVVVVYEPRTGLVRGHSNRGTLNLPRDIVGTLGTLVGVEAEDRAVPESGAIEVEFKSPAPPSGERGQPMSVDRYRRMAFDVVEHAIERLVETGGEPKVKLFFDRLMVLSGEMAQEETHAPRTSSLK